MNGNESRYLGFTLGAIAIAAGLYPASIAPTGELSNGGALGLGFLLAASFLSWWAFTHNQKDPWFRRIVQLPITAVITYLAIHDAFCQCVAAWFQRT